MLALCTAAYMNTLYANKCKQITYDLTLCLTTICLDETVSIIVSSCKHYNAISSLIALSIRFIPRKSCTHSDGMPLGLSKP